MSYLLAILLPLLAAAGPNDWAVLAGRGTSLGAASSGVLASDGSQADVAAKISSASDGYTVTIPAGTFIWTNGITISGKGITLQGGGAGRVVTRSLSSVSLGTGTKVFTTTESGAAITNGQTLTIDNLGTPSNGNTDRSGIRTYMTGTVTSYSGTTLTMDITTSAGTNGTWGIWMVSSAPTTTIVCSNATGATIAITEDASHSVAVERIRFLDGLTGADRYMIAVDALAGGQPVKLRDCYLENDGAGGKATLNWQSNRGIISSNDFASFPFSRAGVAYKVRTTIADSTNSWFRASTMGTNDVGGTNNVYLEGCGFHAFQNAGDWDGGSRTVVRNCLFNNSGHSSHGAESDYGGARHFEVYDCTLVFNDLGGPQTLPCNWWFHIRGGTGVFTDNTIPDMTSSEWGDKSEFSVSVRFLGDAGGPFGCWSNGDGITNSPAPQQVGFGNVNGSGSYTNTMYRGDSEPLYIWNNSGTGPGASSYFGTSNGEGCSGSPDTTAMYVRLGTEVITNSAKSGWVKYTYPHPLR